MRFGGSLTSLLPMRIHGRLPLKSALLGIGLLALCSQSFAAVVTFQQSATYNSGGVTIRNDMTSTNLNGNSQIIVGNTAAIILRGLFEFDLTAIETAAAGNAFTIDSVSLVLTTANATGNGTVARDFTLYSLGTNSDFDEATVAWDTAPSVVGGTIGTLLTTSNFVPTTANTVRTFGTTTAFTTAVSGALASDPDNTVRFLLKANDEAGAFLTRFYTDEDATVANRPALVVNYTVLVPEPSTGVLALGTVGLLTLRRRRA